MNDTSMPRGLTAQGPQGTREVGLSGSKSEGEQREEDWRGELELEYNLVLKALAQCWKCVS